MRNIKLENRNLFSNLRKLWDPHLELIFQFNPLCIRLNPDWLKKNLVNGIIYIVLNKMTMSFFFSPGWQCRVLD
jgi:hypothetical protein